MELQEYLDNLEWVIENWDKINTEVSVALNMDNIDGILVPFFRLFFTSEELWLHFRIRERRLNSDYWTIFDELTTIFKDEWMDDISAKKEASRILSFFYIACQNSVRKKKNPFTVKIEKIYEQRTDK